MLKPLKEIVAGIKAKRDRARRNKQPQATPAAIVYGHAVVDFMDRKR